MEQKYNHYNHKKEDFEKENAKVIEFFKLIKTFQELDYNGRVQYMKDNWGDITDTKIVFFGDKCHVKITFEDNKYHFQFNCHDVSFLEFLKIHPELADQMFNKSINEYAKNHPEVVANQAYHANNSAQTYNTEYLNLYRNLNIINNVNLGQKQDTNNSEDDN